MTLCDTFDQCRLIQIDPLIRYGAWDGAVTGLHGKAVPAEFGRNLLWHGVEPKNAVSALCCKPNMWKQCSLHGLHGLHSLHEPHSSEVFFGLRAEETSG